MRIERDDVVYITVRNHHGIRFSQYILPRADGCIALTDIDVAGLAVIVAELAIRLLYHVWCPYHLCRGPVHHDVLPVYEVLAHPNLSRTVTVASAVGGSIYIIGVAELPDRRVGKVSGDDGVHVAFLVPGCPQYW